jgi:hypothetical protein
MNNNTIIVTKKRTQSREITNIMINKKTHSKVITENIIVRKRIKIGAITKKSQHPKGDQDQSDHEEHEAIMVKKRTKTKAIMKSFTIKNIT